MQRHRVNDLEWLAFDHLSECKNLAHAIFLKHGGISTGSFHSLNFGLSQGDAPENVQVNRSKAIHVLNITKYASLYQQHGTEIIDAKAGNPQKGDALMTNAADIGLLILHADCQAAIFYDPIHHAVANVHCGWRGNVANIYKKTVEAMQSKYRSQPENLLVGISPSLGPTAAEFCHFENELPDTFFPFQVKPFYFDFWEISRQQLKDCGVLNHHIEIAEICTYSSPQDYFSYRRTKKSGRHGTLVSLSTCSKSF